jgi:putative tricarboxylic transport membrane protein
MFFGRPISMAIIAFALLTLFYPLFVMLRKRRPKSVAVERTDMVVESAPSTQRPYRDLPALGFGALFLVVGVMAYLQTKDMSAMGSVFPGALAVALVSLSGLLMAFQIGSPPAPARSGVVAEGKPSTLRRSAIVVALVVWALLMPVLGFFVTSLAAFLILIAIATFERLAPRVIVLYAISAVVIVGAFHLLMANVLNLRMPVGLLF